MATRVKKSKKENNTQPIPANILMALVQIYSSVVQLAKRRNAKASIESPEEKLIGDFIEKLRDRNKRVDVDGLFYSLYRLANTKTLECLPEGQYIHEDLKALNIEIPKLLESCLEEIELRGRIIKNYSEDKERRDDEKARDWEIEIESKLVSYSFDKTSKNNYLTVLFEETVSEITRLEKEAVSKYGYYIDGFYKSSEFVATKEDINNLFFHGEVFAGGYSAFYDIWRLLRSYVEKHNELKLIKNHVATGKGDSTKDSCTHREAIIAHTFKFDAGIEKFKTASEWKKERGSACYLSYYTLQKNTKNRQSKYKAPTLKELNTVLLLLRDYPQLQEKVSQQIQTL